MWRGKRGAAEARPFIFNGGLYIVLIIFMVLIAKFCEAQEVVENGIRKYRVTAYKEGDTTVKSVSNIAEIIPPMTLYIPNAFTPNGDGLNDSFGVSGANIYKFKMLVYNAWGELVFQTDNMNKRWDGKFKGEIMPNSVYLYEVTAFDYKGRAEFKNGNVTLLQ